MRLFQARSICFRLCSILGEVTAASTSQNKTANTHLHTDTQHSYINTTAASYPLPLKVVQAIYTSFTHKKNEKKLNVVLMTMMFWLPFTICETYSNAYTPLLLLAPLINIDMI